ncbi:hypothetical protein Tco_1138151, partial [Tanacetum coccineum]
AIHKNVDNILHDVIPKIASNATNDIIENNLPNILVKEVIIDTFRGSDHDDHQEDDALPEGEKRPKRRKSSRKWDTWVMEPVSDVDEVIPEDESLELNVDEHVPTIYDHKRMEATLKDMMEDDLEERMKRWVKKEFKTFDEEARLSIQQWKDSWHKRLNKINHRKVRANLEEYFFIHKIIEVVRVTTEQQHGYQIRVNLTAPTLTFPGVESCDPYSIVDKLSTNLIYLNSKNEKRVMYLVEIVMFCCATLERVLNEVKLKIFEAEFLKKAPLLGDLNLDIMKAYERETIKCLKNREQMRRWESFCEWKTNSIDDVASIIINP